MISGENWIPNPRDVLAAPLGRLGLFDRFATRGVALSGLRRVIRIEGIANILPDRDPFVLTLNHSTKFEALLLPALLMLLRGGRHIHFMADWNYRLIPILGHFYRSAQVITVPNKLARPRFLTALRPLFVDKLSPMQQARRRLDAGRPVAIFPEGTVNRDPRYLLRGRLGAARLSRESGVSIVPAGLMFPRLPVGSAVVTEDTPMVIRFGAPMTPPAGESDQATLRVWHHEIMSAIGLLSGKLPTSDPGDDHDELRHHAQQTS